TSLPPHDHCRPIPTPRPKPAWTMWRGVEVCYARATRSPSPEQSVEAPVVGVYRENLHPAESRLEGVLTKHRGTHDGTGSCSLRVPHGAGQAGNHTPAVLGAFPRERKSGG